jgi:hypothetical protein
MNNQKAILTLVAAIVITAGVVVTALSIAAPAAQAKLVSTGEKDTRSCLSIRRCVVRNEGEEGKIKAVTECQGLNPN